MYNYEVAPLLEKVKYNEIIVLLTHKHKQTNWRG